MLDTKSTFDGLVRRHSADPEQAERILQNRFYQNISSALSGTQEYMASEKLYELAEEDDWDLVVVDTPPTRNALDFLDAPQRLAHFLDHRLYKVLMTPTRGIVRAVNVAAQAVVRSLSKVVGGDVVADAIAFFQAFEGMEQGFKERAAAVDRLLAAPRDGLRPRRLAQGGHRGRGRRTSRSNSIEHGITVRGARGQPHATGLRYRRRGTGPRVPARRASGPHTLAGTDLGDLYTALADARQLARGEEEHLGGLTDRVAPAPVVRVPVQPFEVNDLEGLTCSELVLGRLRCRIRGTRRTVTESRAE